MDRAARRNTIASSRNLNRRRNGMEGTWGILKKKPGTLLFRALRFNPGYLTAGAATGITAPSLFTSTWDSGTAGAAWPDLRI